MAAGAKLEATGLEAARPEKTRFSSAANLPPTEFFVKETFLPAFRDANLWASKDGLPLEMKILGATLTTLDGVVVLRKNTKAGTYDG